MNTVARARFVRLSARKARLVLDQIRGKSVGDALATLEYTPRAAARLIEKVLRSAVANAEHNHQVRNLDDLRVVHAIADGGPSLKRVQPRAMGRAFFIRHRTSHLTIGVSDETGRAMGAPAARPGRAIAAAPSAALAAGLSSPRAEPRRAVGRRAGAAGRSSRAGAGALGRAGGGAGAATVPFVSSLTPIVKWLVRCLIENARPIARGCTRLSTGPPSA